MGNQQLAQQLANLDATAQAELIRSGQITATEAVDASIAAAEEINPKINAIIHPRYERARDEAKLVDPAAPFAGVPLLVKDLNCAIAGEPHHMGSRALKNAKFTADTDSFLYRRFKRAGFIALGRTNTPEFGSTVTTEPLAYGPARNPWNLDHSTGGSSGGSAASVAARIVAVAHANDGGGSIRVPAGNCGLVGLKPSRSRVSQGPDVGESWMGGTIDGCVTRSVRDTAAILDAITGYENGDPHITPFASPLANEVGKDPGKLRIGFLNHPLLDIGIDHPECRAAVDQTVKLLQQLGHEVEDSFPTAMTEPQFSDLFVGIITASLHADLSALEFLLGISFDETNLEPDNLFFREMGKAASAADYINTVRLMHMWSRRMISWWKTPAMDSGEFDILVTPTLATPAPEIGWLSGPDGGFHVQQILQYTAQFNITGQPALSLPLHMTPDGIPVGVQFVAAPNREDVLVRLASQIEAAAPWADRKAPNAI